MFKHLKSYIVNRTSYILLFAMIMLTACKSAKKEELVKINTLETEILASMNTKFDEKKAQTFIDECRKFAEKYPKDTACATYLFKAGRLAMNLPIPEKANESLIIFDKLLTDYPNAKDAPLALFMKAFFLENNMNNIEKAGETYREFIRKYPNHMLAADAKNSLDNLGKPLEQIIKSFEEKANKDTSSGKVTRMKLK
jgi:outer membrane protein assembly factor BamD (BamD/ComL family)